MQDHAAELEARLAGWDAAMGLHFISATSDRVEAELHVDARHLQPYGIVHGGVYASMIETVASVGAALAARLEGKAVVGLDNSTSFIHAVREGRLRASARALARGRRTHLWEAEVHDDRGRVVATGRVRLLVLAPDTTLAGGNLDLPSLESE